MQSKNRWVILIASVILNLSIGSAYAWSVFQTPLMDHFGWTTGQASLAFTISLSLVPFAMIVAGKFQDEHGPKLVTLLGGIVFGLGLFLVGYVNSITMLYLTYGLLGGVGIGMIYACTVGNTVKWFPDKRGLAGGLTAAGFGLGSVLLAPVAEALVRNLGVFTTFRIIGIVYLVLIVGASFVMDRPDPDWKPEGWEPPMKSSDDGGTESAEINLKGTEMLKTGRFYILWLLYAIGCVSGLMIIGHASPIGQQTVGISARLAALGVSIIGIANTAGRIFWGGVSDRIGRYNTLILMYASSAAMLLLLRVAGGFPTFIIATSGIALGFGGFLGIFPSVTADNFGDKFIGANYGIIFTAYGLAAYIGPMIAATTKESAGGYGYAFLIATILNVAGIVFTFALKYSIQKKKEAQLSQS
ncbi:OFA family MFS transporter [Natroniella sp. ANB-PHB2]|uniref:L-lactate MFS transporter n=1 Tax=Natroniella sp. ANB-PHB2 TaxID=3384444 RepID=UPI0038D3FD81